MKIRSAEIDRGFLKSPCYGRCRDASALCVRYGDGRISPLGSYGLRGLDLRSRDALGDAGFRKSPMKIVYRKLPKTASLPVTPQPVPRPSLAVFFFSGAAYSLTLQLSISSFSFLMDRTAKFRLKTYSLLLPAPTDSVGPPYSARNRGESTAS
jgi:hypothetical protein